MHGDEGKYYVTFVSLFEVWYTSVTYIRDIVERICLIVDTVEVNYRYLLTEHEQKLFFY